MNIQFHGGGLQSWTMWLLNRMGKLPYKIDESVFCDVGDEPLEVYDYFKYMKDLFGGEITVLKVGWKPGKHKRIVSYQKNNEPTDLTIKSLSETFFDTRISKKGNVYNKPMIPLWTEKGKMQRHCTYDFKITPMMKYFKKKKINALIGYTTDEWLRMKDSHFKNVTNLYPLVELRMDRNDCVKFFQELKLKVPPKSSCFYCPYHSKKYWEDLKQNEFEWNRIVEFDKKIRNLSGIRPQLFISASRKPITEMFEDYSVDESCDNGVCFV